MSSLLAINSLCVVVSGKRVITDMSLEVGAGETLALMGANGSGKSSLANAVIGNPEYQVVGESRIQFDGEDLLQMSVDERSRAGIFVAWQNPVTVPGVSILSYLRVIYEAGGGEIAKMTEFRDRVVALMSRVGLSKNVVTRNLNEGFSGGEKKRFELLQLLLLKPKLAILDEIDSGLDVDGLKMVAEIVQEMSEEGTAFVLITHYKKLLDYVDAMKVVVMNNGEVVAQGGKELALKIEKAGYAKYK